MIVAFLACHATTGGAVGESGDDTPGRVPAAIGSQKRRGFGDRPADTVLDD
ncbi:MAG: hypothetical protein AAGA03_00450 [Planctomycetota bacterium]